MKRSLSFGKTLGDETPKRLYFHKMLLVSERLLTMRPRTFSDQELLTTARRLFLSRGLNLPVNAIAKELGVSEAALFRRFSTKERLIVNALAPEEAHAWIEKIKCAPNGGDVRSQLLEILREMDTAFREIMPAYSLLRSARLDPEILNGAFPSGAPPVVAHRELVRVFRTLHREGRLFAPKPEATASAVLGAMHGHHQLKHVLGKQAPDPGGDYVESLIELLWSGLAPRNSGLN